MKNLAFVLVILSVCLILSNVVCAKNKVSKRSQITWGDTFVQITEKAGLLGLENYKGKRLLKHKYDRMKSIGFCLYARKAKDKRFDFFLMQKKKKKITLADAIETKYYMILSLKTGGKLAGVGYMKKEGSLANSQNYDLAHFDKHGNVIKMYESCYGIPQIHGSVWVQKYKNGSTIILNKDGVAVSPPIQNVVNIKRDVLAIRLSENRYLPILKDGGLPVEAKGFLGYEPKNHGKLGLAYWICHYEFDGVKLYGYATKDLSFSTGPAWREFSRWRMSEKPDIGDRAFVPFYSYGHYILAKLPNSNYQMYCVRQAEEGYGNQPLQKIGIESESKDIACYATIKRIKNNYRDLVDLKKAGFRRIKAIEKEKAEKERRLEEVKRADIIQLERRMAERRIVLEELEKKYETAFSEALKKK